MAPFCPPQKGHSPCVTEQKLLPPHPALPSAHHTSFLQTKPCLAVQGWLFQASPDLQGVLPLLEFTPSASTCSI
jgi:hypothetical protein